MREISEERGGKEVAMNSGSKRGSKGEGGKGREREREREREDE